MMQLAWLHHGTMWLHNTARFLASHFSLWMHVGIYGCFWWPGCSQPSLRIKRVHAWKAYQKLGYVPIDATEVSSTTVAARAHNNPIFGKGRDDTTRYAKKPRKTPLAAQHAVYKKYLEFLQGKHAERKGKQKAVPHNFQVGTLVCYAKEVHEAGVSPLIVHGYIIMEKDAYDTVLATARRMHL